MIDGHQGMRCLLACLLLVQGCSVVHITLDIHDHTHENTEEEDRESEYAYFLCIHLHLRVMTNIPCEVVDEIVTRCVHVAFRQNKILHLEKARAMEYGTMQGMNRYHVNCHNGFFDTYASYVQGNIFSGAGSSWRSVPLAPSRDSLISSTFCYYLILLLGHKLLI